MTSTPDGFDLSLVVTRMRWVLVAAIAGSTVLALCCQPSAFWADPANAIRGDLLPVGNRLNHTFSFFLERGALPFLAANFLYAAVAFLVVSRLPALLGLAAILGGVLAHGYGTTNWLANKFHLGPDFGPGLAGVWFGILIVTALQSAKVDVVPVVRRWQWVMIAVLVVDLVNTLVGQPHAYWSNPAIQREGNTIMRYFLSFGWMGCAAYGVVYGGAELLLVKVLPHRGAFIFVVAATFASFVGGSNWFFYEWRLGWILPAAYGGLVGTALALTAL